MLDTQTIELSEKKNEVKVQKKMFSIIIPTFNNLEYLMPCFRSLMKSLLVKQAGEIIIVNNGEPGLDKLFKDIKEVKVIEAGKNLGWEGGLKEGLKHTDAPYVMFLNDDTFLPASNVALFFYRLLGHFSDPRVAIVTPTTTTAAGCQSIYSANSPNYDINVSWAIFFCAIVRRSYLDQVGGIDDTLPGGDDIDLSFRMIKAGYRVVVDPMAFIIHHGFKTGIRVHGDHKVKMGWNSPEMTEATNHALIRKHGFGMFMANIMNQNFENKELDWTDKEGNLIREMLKDEENILELGCGFTKTHPRAVGVDMIAGGEAIDTLEGKVSVADVTADVSKELPFGDNSQDVVISRHVLEHCVDTIETLKNWIRVVKPGGKLIIAVPNHNIVNTIPLNPEHVHAFTPESLRNITELFGLVQEETVDTQNGISFISRFRKL